jgi:hypothetical protein
MSLILFFIHVSIHVTLFFMAFHFTQRSLRCPTSSHSWMWRAHCKRPELTSTCLTRGNFLPYQRHRVNRALSLDQPPASYILRKPPGMTNGLS